MAQDALSLLDFVGWTKVKEVHVVSPSHLAPLLVRSVSILADTAARSVRHISSRSGRDLDGSVLDLYPLELLLIDADFDLIPPGGMISLELAAHSPQRIASLTLAVTSSGHGFIKNLPPVSPDPCRVLDDIESLTIVVRISSSPKVSSP